jgi:Tfp pilus assembly protein PilN
MFTIDLLKGQGIPIKSRPEGVAIATMTFAVPILAAMVMLGFYLSNRIVISTKRQEIANYEKNIEALSNAIELQKSFETEKNNINSCLSEVFSSISSHTQWSPILAIVVKNMPDSMVLTSLEVKQRSISKKVPKKDDPKKMIDVSVPARTLQMSVSGRPQADNDKAVKDFKDRLRSSASLASKIEDIRVSQKSDTFEGQGVVSYEIDCIFKPEL